MPHRVQRKCTKPVRLQRKRIKGYNMQKDSPNGLPIVYVGRPSKYGNPYNYKNKKFSVECFAFLVGKARRMRDEIKEELKGKNLACWCRLDEPCHADVLLMVANDILKE